MNSKRIFLALTLAVAVAISATALRAQTSDQSLQSNGILNVLERQKQAQAQQLEGAWIITVTAVVPPNVPPPPVRTNYTIFARGGVSIGTDRLAPFANAGPGVWEHRGGNEFLWTSIGDNFDPLGNYLGTLKVTSRITVTGHNEFVGVNSSEIRNAAGNVVFRGCNTLRGARIQVESVREDCRSITPPQ